MQNTTRISSISFAKPMLTCPCARRPTTSVRLTHLQKHRRRFAPSAALSDADTAALCATAFAGTVTSACWWLVSSRVSASIETRNLRTKISAQLQEAQLQLLNDSASPAETDELKRKVLKLKILLKKMEEDAEQGRAIQGRNQVPTLTPLAYLRKSLWSMKQIGRKNRESLDTEGEGAVLRADIAGSITLGIMALLVMTHSFLP